jgi:hypothetical protein
MSIHETMDQSKILFDEQPINWTLEFINNLFFEWYLTLDALVHLY